MGERAPLAVGVLGAGALGRHHVRILASLPEARLVGVYDLDRQRAEAVAGEHGTRAYPDASPLLEAVEAAVLAVPTVDHARLGGELLGRGLHLLVEKPMTSTLVEADELIARAATQQRVLAVGHVEFFNPAVQRLLKEPGPVRYVEVQRLGVFSPRSLDIDVVLDLMIHDLQILHALDPSPVREVRATGIDVLSPRVDLATVRLELESGCVANISASRVSSEKTRKLRVITRDTYYSLDYPEQEIKGYKLRLSGETPRITEIDLAVERAEPLRRELETFVAACRGERSRLVSGEEGRRALATALEVAKAIEGGRK